MDELEKYVWMTSSTYKNEQFYKILIYLRMLSHSSKSILGAILQAVKKHIILPYRNLCCGCSLYLLMVKSGISSLKLETAAELGETGVHYLVREVSKRCRI